MRHVYNYALQQRCIRRASTKVNEMINKEFQELYNSTSEHIKTLIPKLLCPNFCNFKSSKELTLNDSVESPRFLSQICHQCYASLCCAIKKSSFRDGTDISWNSSTRWNQEKALQSNSEGCCSIKKKLKSLNLSLSALKNNKLLHHTLCKGSVIHGRSYRHDAVYPCCDV